MEHLPVKTTLRIALVGDYNPDVIAHKAIPLAIDDAAAVLDLTADYDWLATTELTSPEDLVGGLEATIEAEKKYVADAGLTGHFSTWAVPASIANTVASTEYAFLWMAGLIGDCDVDAMSALLSDYCGAEAALTPFVDPGTGSDVSADDRTG